MKFVKFNFSKLIQLIKRYKYIIAFSILILFIIFNSFSVIEGLTGSDNIGEYDFLAPPTSENDANSVDDDTFKKLLMKMNENICPNGKDGCKQYIDVSNPKTIQDYKQIYSGQNPRIFGGLKLVTKEEIQYYIDNGYYPYGGYLVNYLTNQQSPLIKQQKGDTFADKIKTMQKGSPSRQVYSMFVSLAESKKDPQPLSYKIFMGIEPPPASSNNSVSSSASSLSSSLLGSSSSSSSSSLLGSSSASSSSSLFGSSSSPSSLTDTSSTESVDSNYQDFISLCKKTLNS